ncbi:MAG: hypothetical protein ACFFDN_04080 [Candidatus Hodarchaeota archaeon]
MNRKKLGLLIITQLFIVTIFLFTLHSTAVISYLSGNKPNSISVSGTPNILWESNGTVICNAAFLQSDHELCSDGLGGAIITWTDNRNGNNDIYAQRINASGLVEWESNGMIICNANNSQFSPEICNDGFGGAVIVWRDYRYENYNIFAQRINASGHTLWTPNGTVICNSSGNQDYPLIISDGRGGFIIKWESNGIYAQKIDLDGNLLWNGTYGLEVCTAPSNEDEATLCSDGDGGAIITWRDDRIPSYGIFVQRVNSSGNTTWTANGVNICNIGTSYFPNICSDGFGGAIITWEEAGGMNDIYAQKVDSSGNILWTVNGIIICNASYDQGGFYGGGEIICSDGIGGAIIAWQDGRSGINYDIYAQRIDASGVPHWGNNGTPICTQLGAQLQQQIHPDGVGGVVISWSDGRNGANRDDIYAQRVNSEGKMLWKNNGSLVCQATGEQWYPRICSDGTGGVIIAWRDNRQGVAQADVYVQHVSEYMTPPSEQPTEEIPFIPILVNAPAGLEDLLELILTPIGLGITGGLILIIIILAVLVPKKK